MRSVFRQPESRRESGILRSVMFDGPAGRLEALWKETAASRRGSAAIAHPHPLHGGTMHNRVVYRASQALTRSGYSTLRFNFRGVGLSEGRYDDGRGEADDFRAALDEAQRRAGVPILAAGFSFGAAAALRATVGDERVEALIGLGLPVASESGLRLPRPRGPALFIVGERDRFGPPDELVRFLGDSARVVVIPGADHFFHGSLDRVEETITEFLAELARGASASPEAAS